MIQGGFYLISMACSMAMITSHTSNVEAASHCSLWHEIPRQRDVRWTVSIG